MLMERREAKEKFRRSDDLYRTEKFAEALAVLDELGAAFPHTKNILFPRARCLARLGRTEEAMAACDTLIAEFNYGRARKLRAELENRQIAAMSAIRPAATVVDGVPARAQGFRAPGAPGLNFAVPGIDFEAPARPHTPAPVPDNWFVSFVKDWGLHVGIGLVVVLLLVGGSLFAWHAAQQSPADASAAQGTGAQEFGVTDVVRIIFVLDIVATFIAVFMTLLIFDHWPQDTLLKNVAHVVGGVSGTIAVCWIARYFVGSKFLVRVLWVGALSGIFRLNFGAIVVVWLIRTGIFLGAVFLGFLTIMNAV